MGYFDLFFFFKNVIYFQIHVCMTSYDVIMGNMDSLVTLVFFKIKSTKFSKLGYFDANFSKSYIFPNSKLL